MPTKSDLAKIHIAKQELGLSDEAYRDMLHLHFGVASAKDLQPRQVIVLLNKFRARGWKPKSKGQGARGKKKGDNYIEIKPGPSARQQRYILAMWHALGYDVDKLHARCKRQFGLDRFEWLTDERDLFVLITDLRQRCMSAGLDPEP